MVFKKFKEDIFEPYTKSKIVITFYPIQKALSWYSLGVELLKNSRPKLQGSCQVSRKIFCYDLLDIRRKLENNQSAFMRDQALKYFSFIPLM